MNELDKNMISDLDLKLLEFYRDQYNIELERSKFFDRIIQYPTTLLIILVGSAFFVLNKYYPDGFLNTEFSENLMFNITFILLVLSILGTIFSLAKVFYGFTRAYSFLPLTVDLQKRELTLYKHHYKYSEEKTYEDKRKEAKELSSNDFYKDLKGYYVNLSTSNQLLNNKRSYWFFVTRTLLANDLILLIVITILGFLK